MNKYCLRRQPVNAALMLMLVLCTSGAIAQQRYDRSRYGSSKAEDCHFYAKDLSYRYVPPGAGALGGVARGAIGGAVFGGVVGGGRGARRGAMAGAALGVIANGARNNADRDYAYRRAFDDCMDGYRR